MQKCWPRTGDDLGGLPRAGGRTSTGLQESEQRLQEGRVSPAVLWRVMGRQEAQHFPREVSCLGHQGHTVMKIPVCFRNSRESPFSPVLINMFLRLEHRRSGFFSKIFLE